MTSVNPDIILENLKREATTRTQKSLDTLHEILCKYFDSGGTDYSIATIGRLSAESKGPSTVTIRNKTGLHYRRLIEAWATKAGMDMKKPLMGHRRQKEIPTDNKLLEHIDDPALRALFGQIIAERNRYRNHLNILKKQTEIIIDKRPTKELYKTSCATEKSIEVIPALSSVLTDMDKRALKSAISDEFFLERGWTATKAGQVKGELGEEIYKRGYVNAIRKVLAET